MSQSTDINQILEIFGWIPGFEEKFKELLQKPKEELAKRLTLLELALKNIDPQTSWIIDHMFSECYYVDAKGFGHPGILIGALFELKQVRMLLREEYTDYVKNVTTTEWRDEWIPKVRLRGIYELRSKEEKPREEEKQY